MTYLNDVHGIIIGGVQNYIRDECTYDENDNNPKNNDNKKND